MAQYTCSNAACPSGGAVITLSSAGQTFCQQCGTRSLTALAVVVAAPTPHTRVLTTSNAMDAVGGDSAEVDSLIDKWDLTTVSTDEAKKTKDYLFKLGSKSKRIDREGPITNGNRVVTHGKFRLQFGTKTYAGVQIKVDEPLDVATIRRAFRESVNNRRYVEVYLGTD